jgi:hypothetical protein
LTSIPKRIPDAEQTKATAREPLFTIRTEPLGEFKPKFWEIGRPDRLPHGSHGVKEEGQIVVRQQDARQHFA